MCSRQTQVPCSGLIFPAEAQGVSSVANGGITSFPQQISSTAARLFCPVLWESVGEIIT